MLMFRTASATSRRMPIWDRAARSASAFQRDICARYEWTSNRVERGKGAVVLYQVPHCFRSRQQAGCPNRVGSVRVRASKNLTELLNRNEGIARFWCGQDRKITMFNTKSCLNLSHAFIGVGSTGFDDPIAVWIILGCIRLPQWIFSFLAPICTPRAWQDASIHVACCSQRARWVLSSECRLRAGSQFRVDS